MLRSLYSAVSGMNAFQTSLDVVGNNIANVETTGFKASRVEFSDILSQTLSGASAPSAAGVAGIGGTNPQQVGLGVNVAAIDTLFTQGADQQTGVPTDVALDGDGFFMVSPNVVSNVPTATTGNTVTQVGTGSQVYFTRAGNFSVDANGDLVLPDGSKLLGYLSSSTQWSGAGAVLTSPATTPSQLAAVNVSVKEANGSTVPGNFSIGQNGTITVTDPSTGATVATWVTPLAQFFNPSGLQKVGNNEYVASVNSGSFPNNGTGTDAAIGQAGQGGFATFRPGALEASNVNLTQEFTNMIIAQQGFDANSKVINTDNNILSTIQNLEQTL
jgi:flagellar hook protein FlgE